MFSAYALNKIQWLTSLKTQIGTDCEKSGTKRAENCKVSKAKSKPFSEEQIKTGYFPKYKGESPSLPTRLPFLIARSRYMTRRTRRHRILRRLKIFGNNGRSLIRLSSRTRWRNFLIICGLNFSRTQITSMARDNKLSRFVRLRPWLSLPAARSVFSPFLPITHFLGLDHLCELPLTFHSQSVLKIGITRTMSMISFESSLVEPGWRDCLPPGRKVSDICFSSGLWIFD